MNLEILHQRIRAPHSIESSEINTLRELTVKYPFAQVFSILYLKALALNQDLNFDEELQKHAYRITDRSKLYELLQDNTKEDQSPAALEEKQENTSILDESAADSIREKIVDPVEENTTIEVPEENAEQANTQSQIELQADPLAAELEKEMLAHVIASAYSLEMELEDKNEEAVEDKTPVIDPAQPRTFVSWLKTSHQEADKIPTNVAKTKEMLDQLKEVEAAKKRENTPKEKKEFFSPIKTARESVREDNLLYSETLANIFAAQGNYPKAILAFEQLMLTNPEKKLYFAKKIKDLKLKLDS